MCWCDGWGNCLVVGGECCGCVGFGLGVYLVVWVSGLVLGGVCLFCRVRRGFCGLFRALVVLRWLCCGLCLVCGLGVALYFVCLLWLGCFKIGGCVLVCLLGVFAVLGVAVRVLGCVNSVVACAFIGVV